MRTAFARFILAMLLLCVCAAAPVCASPQGGTPLRVGVYNFAPLVATEGRDGAKGFFIDILEHAAAREGWTLSYVPGTWHETFTRLREGAVDLVVCIGHTDERAKQLDLAADYLVLDWGIVYGRRGGGGIATVFDLEGKRVGVLKSSVYTAGFRNLLDQFGIKAKLVEMDEYRQVFAAIADRTVDAGICTNIAGLSLEHDFAVERSTILFSPVKLTFAAPKGQGGEVLAALDRHVALLKADGESLYYRQFAQWLDVAQPWQVPRWLLWGAAGAVAVLLGLGVFALTLRRRVAERTKELVAANGELSRSEQRYRDLFTGMLNPFALGEVVCDEEGVPCDYVHLQVNRAFERLTGLTREKAVGHRITELRSDIDPYWIDRFGTVALTGEPLHLERYSREIDRHLELYVYSPLPGQFAVVFNDITERKANEKRRHVESLRLRALLQLSGMGADPHEKLCDVALQAALDLSGSHYGFLYLYDETNERLTLCAWSSEVTAACRLPDRKTVNTLSETGFWGEVVRQRRAVVLNDFQAPHPRKLGYPEGHVRIDRFMGVPVFEGERIVGVLGVANKALPYDDYDVQQMSHFLQGVWQVMVRKEAEEEQARLREQLLHSQKMDLIGQLAGGIAHDFNNILSGIAGYADLARGGEAKAVDEALASICRLAGRAAQLTNSLLAFSRKQATELVETDLAAVVAETSWMISRLAGSGITLNTAIATSPLLVLGDACQLEQVLMNLTTNACQAMPDGGTLTITCGIETLGEKDAVRHREARPGRFAVVRVADTGVGIPPEHLDRLFEPFFTTKEVGQGTGLGLATVYGIVRDHDGFVLVESAPGGGSTFSVHLPVLDQERACAAISPDRHAGTECILVADPDPLVRQVARYTLEEFGYRVVEAQSGEDLGRIGAEAEGTVDLALADRSLLGELVAWRGFRPSGRKQRVIVMETSSPVPAERGPGGPAVVRVAKPVRPGEILKKVREVLDL